MPSTFHRMSNIKTSCAVWRDRRWKSAGRLWLRREINSTSHTRLSIRSSAKPGFKVIEPHLMIWFCGVKLHYFFFCGLSSTERSPRFLRPISLIRSKYAWCVSYTSFSPFSLTLSPWQPNLTSLCFAQREKTHFFPSALHGIRHTLLLA